MPYVYFIASKDEKYLKIGKANNVPTRFSAISILLPFEVELLHAIQTPDAMWLERYLHDSFSFLRLNGEWFDISTGQLCYLRQWLMRDYWDQELERQYWEKVSEKGLFTDAQC